MVLLIIFLGNIMVILGAAAPYIATRMMVASNKKEEIPTVHYAFCPGQVKIQNQKGNVEYPYRAIQRVFDTTGYFIFYFDDRQVYLMNQKDLKGGSVESFSAFLNDQIARGADDGVGATNRT